MSTYQRPSAGRLIIFGAGPTGKRLLQESIMTYDVIAFSDNDPEKWGRQLEGISIIPPQDILSMPFEYILIASVQGLHAIKNQLQQMGIAEERILSGKSYDVPYFIKNFAHDVYTAGVEGAIAELGVFQGETARHLNTFFPDRKLYLFDTFCGFSENDIQFEKARSYSAPNVGDFHDTSIEQVMQKMPYPENIIIRAGYFPESAVRIEHIFALARLDVDLYKPTLAGLDFFSQRMARGGVILVHDYYTESWAGVRAAVDHFMQTQTKQLLKVPAGDMLSCVIAGF